MTAYVLKSLINNLGFLIFVAYILTRVQLFKQMATSSRNRLTEKLVLMIVFGLIGILATYTGTYVNGAIANSRTVGVLVGGLYGGPIVGIGAGLIAGIHRYSIDVGGFTSTACMISTILGGLIGGIASKYVRRQQYKWLYAFGVGVLAESLQMGIVLIMARPFDLAMELIKIIFVPMVLFNPVGIAMFVALIESIYKEQEKESAMQTQLALDIADRTLPYLKRGLSDAKAVEEVARIIKEMAQVPAVNMTDREQIIVHVGEGEDHHQNGMPILSQMTMQVLETGELSVASTKDEIGCQRPMCKLRSAVIVPLWEGGKVVGTLKLYRVRENAITAIDKRLAMGLAKLFSTQLELSVVERQIKLREKAELRALQSQINPHFIFNTLNTVGYFCRTEPLKAKDLLMDLSTHLRNTLEFNVETVSLETELKHVDAYVSIEKARFGDQFDVVVDVAPDVECLLPQLVLQPIVENAIKHGFKSKTHGGLLVISATKTNEGVKIIIDDNGEGIPQEKIDCLYSGKMEDHKVGLSNVFQRLRAHFGENGFNILRKDEGGTRVEILIPKLKQSEVKAI